MSEPVLQIDAVHLSFAGRDVPVKVLRGVSLRVASGETLALVGPSGSGKSSLLMLAAGLDQPNAGSIQLLGHNLGTFDETGLARLRRGHVGIVFQSFHLIPTMTARENVALPLDLAGETDILERAEKQLAAVGLADRAGHYPGELSGGEQQRVAIARAMVHEPDLLLADEPTGNLDRDTGQVVADLLFGLAAHNGTAMVMATHDPALARRAQRVVRLVGGRTEEVAP